MITQLLRSVILTLALILISIVYLQAQPTTEAIEITIYPSKVISEEFIGNGVQWEAYPHGDSDQSEWGNLMTEDNWQKLYKRLDFVKPRLIRLKVVG